MLTELPSVAATSAVDLDTDKAVQEIIRGPQFADVTMLTIACVCLSVYVIVPHVDQAPCSRHRINTILESDRVLVLDAGRVCQEVYLLLQSVLTVCCQVVEFDLPQNLLANKQSAFHSLAAEAGLA